MPFTVWCNDRLVGESELDYIANTADHQMGDFAATEYGEQLIPRLMEPRMAIMARASADEIRAAESRREALQLELRGPDGAVIPAMHIEITDTEWLLSLAGDIEGDWQADAAISEAELLDELLPHDDDDAERIHADPPPWIDDESDELDEFDVPDVELGGDDGRPPREFPRYQLQVLFER